MTEKAEAEFRTLTEGPEGNTEVVTRYSFSYDEFTVTVSCSRAYVLVYDDVHSTTHTADFTVESSKEISQLPFFDVYRNLLMELQSCTSEFSESDWRKFIEVLVSNSTAWRLVDSSKSQEWEQVFATGEGQVFTSEGHHYLGFSGNEITFEMATHLNTSTLDERDYDLAKTHASNINSILAIVNCDTIFTLWLELPDWQSNHWDSISQWMADHAQPTND